MERPTIESALADSLSLRNAAFAQMTRQEKRVALMQDVLRLLDAGVLDPQPGRLYFSAFLPVEAPDCVPPNYATLAALERCEVCARGAIMVAAVMRGVVDVENLFAFDDSDLDVLFSREERHDIESVFESWGSHRDGGARTLRRIAGWFLDSKGALFTGEVSREIIQTLTRPAV